MPILTRGGHQKHEDELQPWVEMLCPLHTMFTTSPERNTQQAVRKESEGTLAPCIAHIELAVIMYAFGKRRRSGVRVRTDSGCHSMADGVVELALRSWWKLDA